MLLYIYDPGQEGGGSYPVLKNIKIGGYRMKELRRVSFLPELLMLGTIIMTNMMIIVSYDKEYIIGIMMSCATFDLIITNLQPRETCEVYLVSSIWWRIF